MSSCSDGIPKALCKVAALLAEEKTLTPKKLVEQTPLFQEKILDFLLEVEWKSLSEDQQRLMMIFAVYNQHIPINAMNFLAAHFFPSLQVEPCLSSLIRRSLVRKLGAGETFQLYPLDQEYAYSMLSRWNTEDARVERSRTDSVLRTPFSLLAAHEQAAKFFGSLITKMPYFIFFLSLLIFPDFSFRFIIFLCPFFFPFSFLSFGQA